MTDVPRPRTAAATEGEMMSESAHQDLRQRAIEAVEEVRRLATMKFGDNSAASSESLADAVLNAQIAWQQTWNAEESICGCAVETMLRERAQAAEESLTELAPTSLLVRAGKAEGERDEARRERDEYSSRVEKWRHDFNSLRQDRDRSERAAIDAKHAHDLLLVERDAYRQFVDQIRAVGGGSILLPPVVLRELVAGLDASLTSLDKPQP